MPSIDGIWTVLRPVLIAFLLIVLILRMFEDRFIFFPNAYAAGEWNTHGMGLPTEDVFLDTDDGARIHGWWIEADAPEGERARLPTVLVLHGNAGNLTNRIENLLFMRELPVNVFAIDYRRYGKSEGPFPTEEGVYRDARAAYHYVVDKRGVDPARLVVLGQSLGTAIAVQLASEREVAGLILEAGFSSAPRVAQVSMPLPGVRFLMRSRFDSASKLPDIHVPVLVAHCVSDPIISYRLGKELFEAANQPKSMVTYDSACHEPLYDVAFGAYADELRGLIRSATGERFGPPAQADSP